MGPGSSSNDLGVPVKLTGVSGIVASGFQTDNIMLMHCPTQMSMNPLWMTIGCVSLSGSCVACNVPHICASGHEHILRYTVDLYFAISTICWVGCWGQSHFSMGIL